MIDNKRIAAVSIPACPYNKHHPMGGVFVCGLGGLSFHYSINLTPYPAQYTHPKPTLALNPTNGDNL